MKTFKNHLSEKGPIGPVKKGQMHKDLGKSSDAKITSKDIAKEKAMGGVEKKRAVFAQNAKKWHHEGIDMTADLEKVLAFEGAVEHEDPLTEEAVDEAYSKSAVDKEIRKDKRIGGKEAKAIHRLLKGRQSSDEPETFKDAAATGNPRHFAKEEIEQIDEGKVYDPISKKMVPKKPIKSQAGGTATRGGKPVEVGPSKKWQKTVGEEIISEEHDMSDAAHELVLHADNDSHLHHGSHMPIINNLKKKMKKGNYDPEKAKKLWGYHADRAAQSYHKQYGEKSQPWHKMFSTHDRKQAASHWEASNRDELHESVDLSEAHTIIDPSEAKNILNRHNAYGKDFHELSGSQVDGLVQSAHEHNYRKSKNAPGSTGRMFHAHLHRMAARFDQAVERNKKANNE